MAPSGILIQDGDMRKVSELLIEIEAITNDEFVGHFEALVVNRHFNSSAVRFGQQAANPKRTRAAILQVSQQVIQCQTSIDNVFHEDNVGPKNAALQVFDQSNFAGAISGRSVAHHRHEINSQVQFQMSDEIREEDNGTAQDSHHERLLSFVVTADFLSQLSNAICNPILFDQNLAHCRRPLDHGSILACAF